MVKKFIFTQRLLKKERESKLQITFLSKSLQSDLLHVKNQFKIKITIDAQILNQL